MLNLKLLEKQEQAEPKIRREMMKISAEINELETPPQKNTKNQQNKKLVL
jgi:Spy/CpxP family protein refolding chaperone